MKAVTKVTDRIKAAQPRRFRLYPAYWDSGVEWLGEIPAHWSALPIKRVCRFRYGDSLAADDRAEGEVVVFGSNGPVGNHDTANTAAPCLIVGRKGSFGKVNYSAEAVFAIDTTFAIDARCTREDLRWLYYTLQSVRLDMTSKDSAIPGLDREDAYARAIAMGPIREQGAIAEFLDRETAKIDALVARKERLIELLQEKRTALITRAVTRGPDPNVPMKDSGVEWLGEIPAHWEPARLWRLCTAISGATPSKENLTYWNGEIPWVSPKDMKRRVIATSEDLITQQALDEAGLKLIAPQVVLVVVRGMILAHSFPVAVTVAPVTINQDMKALMLTDGVDCSYFAWALEGLAPGIIATVVAEAAHGTRVIRMDQWRNVVCPVPPSPEQRAIVHILDRETAGIDALIAKVQEAIGHLREFRIALISAAVTGKVDVRETPR